MAVKRVILTGYTPYPIIKGDNRLPHIANKNHNLILKTALGAQKLIPIEHSNDIKTVLIKLSKAGYTLCALEQASRSIPLSSFKPPEKIVLIVGREVEGIEQAVLKLCDKILEIPMLGKKESLNVVQASAMALYHLRFYSI